MVTSKYSVLRGDEDNALNEPRSMRGGAKAAMNIGLYTRVLIFILKTNVAYSSLGYFISLHVVIMVKLE